MNSMDLLQRAKEQQDKINYKYYIEQVLTAGEIGIKFGVSKSMIGNKLSEYGIKKEKFPSGKQDFSKKTKK